MDETLALSFCPFRSPDWKTLVNKEASIEFSQHMWARVLEIVKPRAIVCLGGEPAHYLDPSCGPAGPRRRVRRSATAQTGEPSRMA